MIKNLTDLYFKQLLEYCNQLPYHLEKSKYMQIWILLNTHGKLSHKFRERQRCEERPSGDDLVLFPIQEESAGVY